MNAGGLTGQWIGRNSLWLQPGTPVFESQTTASIVPVAGGKVTKVEYRWQHEGVPQDGVILVAGRDTEGVHMAWCDSFHMDTKIMELAGEVAGEVLAANGSYQVEDSEPWGWRIELRRQGSNGLQMLMYNILPPSLGGVEALAVQADYTRAG